MASRLQVQTINLRIVQRFIIASNFISIYYI